MAKDAKKQKKSKLKSLVLLLFLTIVLLSTSTYAWFTANRSVSIEPINVQIATSSGLQISTNASTWKTSISNADINSPSGYSSNKNMLPYHLQPVSTVGTVKTGGYLDFYKGTVEGASNLGGALGLTAVNTGNEAKFVYDPENPSDNEPFFVAFDIFLKAEPDEGNTNIPIYLDRGSGVVSTSDKPDKHLQYAARYAFLILGNDASTAQVSDLQALNGSDGTTLKVVEPNYDAHTDTGVVNASQNYGITTTAGTSGIAAVNYVGVKAAISTPVVLSSTDSTKFGSVPGLIKTNVAYSTTTDATYSYDGKTSSDPKLVNIFTLQPGVTKIRVYMWIEGQDVDCENAASGAYLTYSIGLTMDTPA